MPRLLPAPRDAADDLVAPASVIRIGRKRRSGDAHSPLPRRPAGRRIDGGAKHGRRAIEECPICRWVITQCGGSAHLKSRWMFGPARTWLPRLSRLPRAAMVEPADAKANSAKTDHCHGGWRIRSRHRRPDRDRAITTLQGLRVLPQGPAKPLPEYALLRLGHANASYSGCVPAEAGGGSLSVPQGRRWGVDQRGSHA